MIEWVLRRTEAAGVFDKVVVATDHQEIARVVDQVGGHAVMTSEDCQTGTDRVADAARQLPGFEIVANVQGDQPFVDAEMLTALVAPYRDGDTPDMTTVATKFSSQEQFAGPSAVKVIRDITENAVYFSRSVIPHGATFDSGHALHHLGLYAFRAEFLQSFCKMAQTPLELSESLEQLRCLENGHSIYVSEVARPVIEVNTAEELEQANQIAEQDGLSPAG